MRRARRNRAENDRVYVLEASSRNFIEISEARDVVPRMSRADMSKLTKMPTEAAPYIEWRPWQLSSKEIIVSVGGMSRNYILEIMRN